LHGLFGEAEQVFVGAVEDVLADVLGFGTELAAVTVAVVGLLPPGPISRKIVGALHRSS
jgi:hypothetical protein